MNDTSHEHLIEPRSRSDVIWVGGDLAGSGLAGLLALLGVAPTPAAMEGLQSLVGTRCLRAGASLFHEGQAAQTLHAVRSGQFKVFRTQQDGYEQVLGFPGRGELLGLAALGAGQHATGAVALEDASVYTIGAASLAMLGQRLPGFQQRLLEVLSQLLAERTELAELMAAVASDVRLARFLVQCANRAAGRGQSPRRLRLRMSRRDIGSYLGLAHETVSRALRALSREGLVRVEHRDVEILDGAALARFALSTRRKTEDMSSVAVAGRAPRANPKVCLD